MKVAYWTSPVVEHEEAFAAKITLLVVWVFAI